MTTLLPPPRRTLPLLPLRSARHVPKNALADDETLLFEQRGILQVHLKTLPLDHPPPRQISLRQLDRLRQAVPTLTERTTDLWNWARRLPTFLARGWTRIRTGW